MYSSDGKKYGFAISNVYSNIYQCLRIDFRHLNDFIIYSKNEFYCITIFQTSVI